MKPVLGETIPYNSLWRMYGETKDTLSQEELILKYMHLVEKMANKISMSIPNKAVPKEDLMSMGYIGLIEAIKKYDYKKGYQFETYGLWRIKGAMLDGLRKMDWVPRGVREKAKKINKAMRDLEQALLRIPSTEELSDYLKISPDEIDEAMAAMSLSTLLSLNEPFKENDGSEKQQVKMEKIIDEGLPRHERHLQTDEFKKLVIESIERMTEKERLVISLFYYEGLSQVEIAEVMNLTKGRISQLHAQAIVKMRKTFQARGYSMDSFQ